MIWVQIVYLGDFLRINMVRELKKWDRERNKAGKGCINAAATTVGNWSLTTQRLLTQLHGTFLKNVQLKGKEAGVFIHQIPSLIAEDWCEGSKSPALPAALQAGWAWPENTLRGRESRPRPPVPGTACRWPWDGLKGHGWGSDSLCPTATPFLPLVNKSS